MSSRETDLTPHLPLKPEIFQILLALSQEGSLHGYGILKAVEGNTDGRMCLAPSLLYRRIKRMLERGIVAEADPPAARTEDERRRYYALTELGARVLAAEAERLVELVGQEHVRRLAREHRRG